MLPEITSLVRRPIGVPHTSENDPGWLSAKSLSVYDVNAESTSLSTIYLWNLMEANKDVDKDRLVLVLNILG